VRGCERWFVWGGGEEKEEGGEAGRGELDFVVWLPCAILGDAALGLEVVLITGPNALLVLGSMGLVTGSVPFAAISCLIRRRGWSKSTTRWRMLLG
jgi:hypothetical protein